MNLEPGLLGREQQAVRVAQILAEDFVQRRRGGGEYAKVSLDHALLTIQGAGLTSKRHGDAKILATAIRCDHKFAMKLLRAVDAGCESSLYTRHLRAGAIKGTEYPRLLRQFVLEPENSRAHPGKEQVSVGRNLPKVPKRVLCRSREKIVEEFLQKYPECGFHRSVLMREFPQECRTATARDYARNSCVLCTNFRAKMARLRKAGLLVDDLHSTRAMAARVVCSNHPEFEQLTVLSWKEPCCLGSCTNCPTWSLVVPEGRKAEVVTVSLWGDQLCPIRGKKIHNRFPVTMSLQELVTKCHKILKLN